MPGEIEGNQPSLIRIGTHEQPPPVPSAPLFSEFVLESERQHPSHEIPGLEIEQDTPPIFFPELKLRTGTNRLAAALTGLSANDPVSRTEFLRCFNGIPRKELSLLKKLAPDNPLADVFARMDGRTKSLSEVLDEAGINLAQQTVTVFKDGSDAIPKEQQIFLVDAILASLMDESQPENIQLAAQSAYDRIHTTLEAVSEGGGSAIIQLLRKVPVRVVAPVTVLSAMVLSGCAQPARANILFTPTGETPAATTALPTESPASPTPSASSTRKPTEVSPTLRPTKKPTQPKPSPTPTRTEIPPTITPRDTVEPSPTPEGVWCNVGFKITTVRTNIMALINQGKDPLKEPANKPTGLVTQILFKNGLCGFSRAQEKDFQQAHSWGYTDKQIQECKEESLVPLLDENWENPHYWFFTDPTKNWEMSLFFSEDGSNTCSWVLEEMK